MQKVKICTEHRSYKNQMAFATSSLYLAHPSVTVKSSEWRKSVDWIIDPRLSRNVLLKRRQTLLTTAIKRVTHLVSKISCLALPVTIKRRSLNMFGHSRLTEAFQHWFPFIHSPDLCLTAGVLVDLLTVVVASLPQTVALLPAAPRWGPKVGSNCLGMS